MLLAAGATAAVFCAPGATGTASGLHGIVTRAPIAPVCRIGVSCSGPARHVVVQFARQGRVVGAVRTDERGRYRIALAAGSYSVRIARRFGVAIAPRRAVVRAAEMRRVDLAIDTGIR